MTPADFKSLRQFLGFSTQGLARLLQVSDGRTVRRWESGDRGIPGPVCMLMCLLSSGVITTDDLATEILAQGW